MNIQVRTLPDRNFVAGFAKNPATYVAEFGGEYFEAFVSEYADEAAFRADASAYFNRQ